VGGGGGGAATLTSDTPPASPVHGQLWHETDTGQLFIYLDDGTSSQWVAATLGMPVSMTKSAIVAIVDGGGSAITAGMKGYLEVPFNCTLNQADMIADRTGSIVVDVWKCTYAQFDAGATHPVVGDKITASTPPTITTNVKSMDSSLASWVVALTTGDILAFNVDSAVAIQRVVLTLRYTRA
jgi:phosphate/sulfate permease